METKDIEVLNSEEFEYNGIKYDIRQTVKVDTRIIKKSAEESHKDYFDRLYKKSIIPSFIRIFLNEKDEPVFGMLIYYCEYQDWYKEKAFGTGREACGNYYPIENINGKYYLEPHPYQASICW